MKHIKDAYQKEIKELEELLKTNIENGLTNKAARKRLEENGPNILKEQKGQSILKLLLKQFKSLVMLLLTLAAIASFLIGEHVEAIAVFVVIIITALIGLIMEYRAGKAIQSLKENIKDEANVLRKNQTQTIETEKIVLGDIVLLEEGDKVPADGRIIETNELALDESMLTGESETVNKNNEIISEDKKPTNQANIAFMGTNVVKGKAKILITATSLNTEMGNISDLLSQTEKIDTPLEKRLEKTGRFLIGLTLIITFILAIVGILSGNTFETMVKTAIALAIAAVPEGLPAAATITLAIGMKRMSRKNALVRNLPAVETLGSTTVLCTDKTGTLTENEMTLKKFVSYKQSITIEGTGYQPQGDFLKNDKKIDVLSDDLFSKMVKVGYFCNDAKLQKDGDDYQVLGDPTEGALIVAGKKAGLDELEKNDQYKEIETLPFNTDNKYMVTHYKTDKNKSFIAVKGAPDVLLSLCDYYEEKNKKKLSKKIKKKFQKLNDKLAKKRYRLLALAYKEVDFYEDLSLEKTIENDLIFLGFACLEDPAREGIEDSIKETKNAGIKTIMLTGDQEKTAIGIAKDINLDVNQKNKMDDKEIEDLSKKELIEYLKNNSIFSRVTPENKLSIVEALQESNEIVAMTGDGVNDAPALKKADIGVAMGKRGTEVAKESADMILLDDRYQTIVEAIKQGRVIFDNIQKFIHYLLSCNLSEIIFIFLAILIGLPVPLVALQILWLNVATGVFPALSMAWESPEKNVMKKPPIEPNSRIITNKYRNLIGLHGFLLALGPLSIYYFLLKQDYSLETARTVGFMTLALVHLFQVFNVRKKNGHGFDQSFFNNIYLIGSLILTFALQLLAIYFLPLQNILDTTTIQFDLWLYILIGAIIPIIIIQITTLLKLVKNNNHS